MRKTQPNPSMPLTPPSEKPPYSARWARLAVYAGFDDSHAVALAKLRPLLEPYFPAVVEQFYAAIEADPSAKAVFVGGDAQIERQKASLAQWLQELFSGTYDAEYVDRHARIGRTHVRIGLVQQYMFGAMALVRRGLLSALDQVEADGLDLPLSRQAIDLVCDLELAIMLETYSDHMGEQMRAKERLATLGQLAGFVGHELRNPLAVMETSLHLLGKRLRDPDERVERHLRRLSEQVTLSSGIISGLLELTRDRQPERRPVPLHEATDRALRAIPGGTHLEVEREFAESARVPSVDPTHLHHLLVNLVTNAAQAVAEGTGRRIWLRARADGQALVLEVDDEGPGLSESITQRLFEPLNTTRAYGLGLGLALCRKIAEKHGGSIHATNRKGGGARFTVRLEAAFTGDP